MIKMKNLLAENMVRFGTKNLAEADKKKIQEQTSPELKPETEDTTFKLPLANGKKLEVMKTDLGNGKRYTWDEATAAVKTLGRGWRLPTKEELELMYANKDKIGGFADNDYWSSTEDGKDDAWIQYFTNGNQTSYGKYVTNNVRAVRALK